MDPADQAPMDTAQHPLAGQLRCPAWHAREAMSLLAGCPCCIRAAADPAGHRVENAPQLSTAPAVCLGPGTIGPRGSLNACPASASNAQSLAAVKAPSAATTPEDCTCSVSCRPQHSRARGCISLISAHLNIFVQDARLQLHVLIYSAKHCNIVVLWQVQDATHCSADR